MINQSKLISKILKRLFVLFGVSVTLNVVSPMLASAELSKEEKDAARGCLAALKYASNDLNSYAVDPSIKNAEALLEDSGVSRSKVIEEIGKSFQSIHRALDQKKQKADEYEPGDEKGEAEYNRLNRMITAAEGQLAQASKAYEALKQSGRECAEVEQIKKNMGDVKMAEAPRCPLMQTPPFKNSASLPDFRQ